MARGLQIRLACTAALLGFGLAGLAVGTRFGIVHLNAGEMSFVFGPSENGLTLGMAPRGCPPHCGFDINWQPVAALRTGSDG
ncbi:MAG: hypothetical protein R3C46_02225 [Hyphomonadaceae bacterium]